MIGDLSMKELACPVGLPRTAVSPDPARDSHPRQTERLTTGLETPLHLTPETPPPKSLSEENSSPAPLLPHPPPALLFFFDCDWDAGQEVPERSQAALSPVRPFRTADVSLSAGGPRRTGCPPPTSPCAELLSCCPRQVTAWPPEEHLIGGC